MDTGLPKVPLHRERFYVGENPSYTRNEYIPTEQEKALFSRIVTIPATNIKTIGRLNQGGSMDMKSIGSRQPIEHPATTPVRTRASSDELVHKMEHLAMRTPSEHFSQPAQHRNEFTHSNTAPEHLDRAMQQSRQRVNEWNDRSYSSESESFMIDPYTDTMLSDLSSNQNPSPMPNTAYDPHMYQTQRSQLDEIQSQSSRNDDFDCSSDDDTGLQKSMTCIQKPPDVDTNCSRQNSNGSQSSLESAYSFTTMYPSGESHYRAQQRQVDKNRQPPQKAAPVMQEPHPGSTRNPATTSTEPYFGHSQPQTGARTSSECSRVRQINQRADEASRQEQLQKPTSVFVTYAEEREDKNFKKLVLQLTRTLLSNGIQVRLDMLESTLMSMSVSSWLDDNIQKCDFVVICVSPSYKAEVEQPILSITPDPHSLHTRYIYNRLLTQYIQNGSLNYRFIPVLIGGATRKDLPSLCLDTHVYEWPKDFESIIYRLFKKEIYIQPKLGPPPKCTVETYESFNERVLNK